MAKIYKLTKDDEIIYALGITDAIIDPTTRKSVTRLFSELADVARSGSYNDLTDTPNIPEGVIVDASMSSQSTNPVQNKVIVTALEGKVDKVTGKGLSSNDFTDAEKTKLAGLSNYDDSAAIARIVTLEEWKTLMTGASADNIINTFKEMQDFLATIDGADNLATMLTNLRTTILSSVTSEGYQKASDVATAISTALAAYTPTSSLATVATSGSYNDLSNRPTIPIIDAALSSSSENAVQNKVVKSALDTKINTADAVQATLIGTTTYNDFSSVIP